MAESWPVGHPTASGMTLVRLHQLCTAACNRFHSGMVRATQDPWSSAVTAPMARNLKLWFAFVRPSAANIQSSSADHVVLLCSVLPRFSKGQGSI